MSKLQKKIRQELPVYKSGRFGVAPVLTDRQINFFINLCMDALLEKMEEEKQGEEDSVDYEIGYSKPHREGYEYCFDQMKQVIESLKEQYDFY